MSNLHQSVVDQVRKRIGATLKGTWRIDALIGMGGMAAVYAATHLSGSRVAIKMLHPALSLDDDVRKRFAREGYVANTIGHPGVARVVDDGVAEDGSAFLVMELLDGETVAARAVRFGGKLSVTEVAFIGEAIAEVLASAHASRVIHRDIKPDNIFVTRAGRVVVLDFGIARFADAAGVSDSHTRAGTMMGTPAFMPPEQARGRANEMDATSDVWALGATLFWLAAGRAVHEAETPNEQLVAAATLPAPSLGKVAPGVPDPMVTVIDKALEFAKENRFHDAVAMQRALHAAVLAISWGPGGHPGLEPSNAAQVTINLRVSRSDGATTLSSVNARTQLRTAKRTTMLVRAAAVGGLLAAVVLVGVAIVVRTVTPSTPEPEPIQPTPPVASSKQAAVIVTSSAPPPVVLSVSVAEPPATASVRLVPTRLPATQTTRTNWLDGRN